MTRLPTPGGDEGTWGDILNQFLLRSHTSEGNLKSNTVTTSVVVDDNITEPKLSPAVRAKLNASSSTSVSDATTTSKGIIQLGGDLSGTAAAPTVPGLTTLTNNKIDKSEKGQPNGVAQLDGSGKLIPGQLVTSNITKILPYSYSGPLAVNVGSFRLYNDSGTSWTIAGIRASLGAAPAGAAVIVDISKNGTTVFTTQANRPTIAAGSNTSGNVTNMDVKTVAAGEYLTVDIDQIGSTSAGTDLTVQIEVY